MNRFFKLLIKAILPVYILFFYSLNVFAVENKLCLDTEGFIYPVFEKEKICENKSDIAITLSEFRHIKEFAKKERLKELKKFKLQVKNNKIEKNLNKEEVKSLAKEVVEKSKIKASLAEKKLKAEKAREDSKKRRFNEILKDGYVILREPYGKPEKVSLEDPRAVAFLETLTPSEKGADN